MKAKIKKWSEEEILFIINNYGTMLNPELGKVLGRSESSVQSKSERINISKEARQQHQKLRYIRNAEYNSSHFVGENNPKWKNGITKNNYHYKKIQKERYPEKVKARELVFRALRSGTITKAPCEVCSEIKVQAHHEDYSKPLDVNWLCRKHHRERDLIKQERDKKNSEVLDINNQV